jgi:uncharacterized protein (TIGR00369 family)
MATMLEFGQQMVRGEREPFPLARLLDLVMKAIEPGWAVFALQVEEQHHNPVGTLHGGVYCDLADAAMGWAFAATLAEDESFTSVEMKINFLRPMRAERLTAEAKVVKAGSTMGFVECEIRDEQGQLVAKAASTCMRLKKE